MPSIFEVELSDGRVVELEADREPSEDEVLSAVGQFRVPESEWTFPELPPPPSAEPPGETATTMTGFGEELRQNAGDIFRSGLRFIPSTLRDFGVAQTRLDQGGRYDPVLGRTVTSREMAQERAAAFPGTPVPIPPSVATPESHPLYRAGEKVESMLEDLFPRADVPDLATSIREGFGQVGSMLATGGAAKGLRLGRVGATTAATTLGGVMEFDDAFQRARARKDNPDTAFAKALGYTTVASLLENRLGAGRLLRQLMPSAAEAAKKLTALGVSKKILGNFISGGAEEGGQRFAQNWIVEGKPSTEGIMQEAIPGAIVEGVLGLPGAGVRPPRQRTQAEAPEIPAAPTSEPSESDLDYGEGGEMPQTPGVFPAVEPSVNAPPSASAPTKEAAVEPTKAGEPTAAKEPFVDWEAKGDISEGRAKGASGKAAQQFRAIEQRYDAGTPAEQKALDLISDNEFGTRFYRRDVNVPDEAISEAYTRLMGESGLEWKPPQPPRAENAPGRKAKPSVRPLPMDNLANQLATLRKQIADEISSSDLPEHRKSYLQKLLEPIKDYEQKLLTPGSEKQIRANAMAMLESTTRKAERIRDEIEGRRPPDPADYTLQEWLALSPENTPERHAQRVAHSVELGLSPLRPEVLADYPNLVKPEAKPAPKAETPKPTEAVARVQGELDAAEDFAGKASNEAEKATVAWATHVEDVVNPLKAKIRKIQSEVGQMAGDARRTKPEVKGKQHLTKKKFLEQYGVASMEEANALYKKKNAEWADLEKQLELAESKRKELESAKERRGKEWSSAATRAGELRRQVYPKVKEGDVGQAGEAPAAGFFPRVSEATGMGEPSMPPTLEEVRQQRAREAAPAAPGAKTKESGGVWFAGKNPQETAAMMQARATAFLQGKTDQQAVEDLTRLAGGDPNIQLDNQAANFVIKDLLVRASDRANKTTNPVEAVEAWAAVDRLAELSRRLGSEDARSLVSRKLAYRQIDWLMPVLAWRGIVKDQWRKALGLEEGQPLDESVITPEEAKKRGLPELNGEQTRKITKLSKEAEKLPQGIRRNKVMDEMVKEIQKGAPVSKLDLMRDIWYASVLARFGTFLNVLAGSYATGASFTAMAALDRAVRLHPVQAMRIVGQFIGGTYEGALIAKEIASKGAWHLLPDAELRFSNLLSGKAGTRYDNLEELLRRRNPLGILAYTRRFMTALDYIGAEGTRDSQLLYAALTRNDQESLDALGKRFDTAQNARAAVQARLEMGPKASRAEVLVRKREILEEGVSEELQAAAINTARRSAQNANPRGIPGAIYQFASKLPFWFKAPTGLAFIRAGMNMVQNAVDYMPVLGAVNAARGHAGTLPAKHPLRRVAGLSLDIPIEERRMMWAAQGASLGIAAIAAAMFLGDDEDDEGWEISGSWAGVSPSQRKQLMELGERPNSIRFGKKGPWISFKQMPFAPPLAIVGTMRDEERFHAKDWNAESAASKMTSAWLSGLLYIRDLSALSGIAGMFDANAWNTQEKPTKLTERLNRWAAQSIGRAASGYIPSIIKEIDEFSDTKLYRPSKDEIAGWWIRNVPYARRTVGPGPALNNFGEPVQTTPPPIKSWAGFGKDNDLYNTLGELATKGIFLPDPGRTALIVDTSGNRREMTEDEWYQFIKIRGPLFKRVFNPDRLKWLKTTKDENVKEFLQEASEEASAEAKDRRWPAPIAP